MCMINVGLTIILLSCAINIELFINKCLLSLVYNLISTDIF